jgi:hypothetical protein
MRRDQDDRTRAHGAPEGTPARRNNTSRGVVAGHLGLEPGVLAPRGSVQGAIGSPPLISQVYMALRARSVSLMAA